MNTIRWLCVRLLLNLNKMNENFLIFRFAENYFSFIWQLKKQTAAEEGDNINSMDSAARSHD